MQDNNPYIGPRPFENTPADIARFFGRWQEARDLFSLVIAQRAVLFYGQSGTGKTSLLNAALIPLLQERQFDILFPMARVQGRVPPDGPLNGIRNIYITNALLGWS